MLTAFRRGRRVLRLIWQTLKRFESMERRRDAAALTYTTLFALVPVITVTYAILSAIPSLQALGTQAHTNLLAYVMPEGSDLVSDYLVRFSEQARELTWIGVVFLFFTALMLMQTIEQQFNKIWQVDVSRSTLQRFFRYWTVLSLGPLLFGAAQAVSSLLASLSVLPEGVTEVTASVPSFARLVPWSMTVAAITFVYMMVPNCKVPPRDAVIAALVVATVFETGKFLFAKIVGMFPSYQLIYGAFAAVPLFLLWTYLSWMLLLFGAELTYALSHPESLSSQDPLRQRLALAATLYQGQQGGKGMTENELRRRLRRIPAAELSALLKRFQLAGWVTQSQDDSWIWLPDMRQLTLEHFFADLSLDQLHAAEQAVRDDSQPGDAPLHDWLAHWQQDVASSLSVSLDQLLDNDGGFRL
ncbi:MULTISPECIES: YihY family inner membrane protein [unclassified Oceanobacter]|jgi:membrane protein|uniref:YihY family inner membrane protein n=1 Tax=unclassified Oceanobacter TaxID=2620260 RepID=UPI00273339F1|nr:MULTISPECIES: YihY family inner membrane protein [unclassified Oceanobacter]MDP2507039.1 YihY family inner membrane protein [Oceanobacter sp. 3_MG-2023]MDP2548151.1 YihY family inner membrane protein [Oceanobacter sp. 4_MG-2023]